jgi:PAS domain S-box-containing protein
MAINDDLYLDKNTKQILDALPDGVTIYDSHATLVWVNASACEILGVGRDDLIGLNISEMATLPTVETIRTIEFGADTSNVKEFRREHRELSSYASPGYMVFKDGKSLLYSGKLINDQNGNLRYAVYTQRAMRELDEAMRRIAELEKLTNLYRDQLVRQHSNDAVENVISASRSMDRVIARADKIARLKGTVLITGETGVGKNVMAQYIHGQSSRAKRPFIQINCAALPESLFESELFGYTEGSFTGANRKGRRGLIEMADGGTLFLDEIAEMPTAMQAKLLSVVEDRTIRRLGSECWHDVDVRIIAATNKDPEEMRSGVAGIRSDLYYRLSMSSLHIPPLRKRKSDIAALAEHAMAEFNDTNGANLSLHAGFLGWLKELPLPGNAREIRNIIWQIAIEYTPESDPLMQVLIPPDAGRKYQANDYTSTTAEASPPVNRMANKDAEEATSLAILVERHGGDVYKLAEILGVHRTTVIRKLKRFGIEYERRHR